MFNKMDSDLRSIIMMRRKALASIRSTRSVLIEDAGNNPIKKRLAQ